MLRKLVESVPFLGRGAEDNAHASSNDNEPVSDSTTPPYSSTRHHLRKGMICPARPGLITLLDVALYRTNEGQLTRTVMSANATLHTFLQLKQEANALLKECLENNARTFASIYSGSSMTTTGNHSSKRGTNSAINSNTPIYDAKLMTIAAERHIMLEKFARHVTECANDAILRLSTDKTSISSNVQPDSQSTANNRGAGIGMDNDDISVGKDATSVCNFSWWNEIGSRLPTEQQEYLRKKDCWESPLLLCPDYVWADEAHVLCQRMIRSCMKHDFITNVIEGRGGKNSSGTVNVEGTYNTDLLLLGQPASRSIEIVGNILSLLRYDFPSRLHQFRCAIEADATVSKRLYLIKNEYRAPYRAFLESFVTWLHAPKLSTVDDYIRLHHSEAKNEKDEDNATTLKNSKIDVEHQIQDCLNDKILQDALLAERDCEVLEVAMSKQLSPFCELARMLIARDCLVIDVPNVIENDKVPMLQELMKRLANLRCRRANSEKSTGIRPLLLDIQGLSRKINAYEMYPFFQAKNKIDCDEEKIKTNMETFFIQLKCIHELSKNKQSGFYLTHRKDNDIPISAVKACATFDEDVFRENYMKWFTLSKRERDRIHRTKNDGETISSVKYIFERMRQLEKEMSISQLPKHTLVVVKQRLEQVEQDKLRRFQILQDMVKEVCLREMDLDLKLELPSSSCDLELPTIKASLGIFGPTLLDAEEALPVG